MIFAILTERVLRETWLMTDLKPEGFVEAVRKVVQTLRYGPRELTLATFGLLLLALPSVLPKEQGFFKPVLAWLPWVGVLLLAVAAWLIWRKVVAPVPEGKPKPAAIKGPAAFGPHDAELFARLGRNEDLDRLRDWILDDQKPLVALMGESGVGKTSLLRAGLESHLKGDAVQVIYWEALPTDPEEGLLHAVQSRWANSTAPPASFATLASAVARGKRVVVIDQAEQLSPDQHRGIFEMLRQVATASPPYAATWVVAFRREYLPVWRDFELGLPEPAQRRFETLSLRRFLPEQAERVIAVLVEEAGMPVEQKVVKALVESIKSEGRVTPADIGISLLALSESSSSGKNAALTLENFRDHGGQASLLTQYLEWLLKKYFLEAEQQEILQGLLFLIDLGNDQRLSEGRTPQELEKAARPANQHRFEAALRFLASGRARVLEEVPEPPLRYRLIHERLIPAIRRLTGILLVEVEQAGVLLERAYRIWSRDRKARYLLSGRELRQVLRFRDQLTWGDDTDQKQEFLRLARHHRNRLWLSVAVVLMAVGLVSYLYSEHQSKVAAERALLSSWKLPPDLLDYLEQIEDLALPGGVTRFDWLKKAHRLRSLTIEDSPLASLEGLPEGLRSLTIRAAGRQLPRLPPGLASLDINLVVSNPADLPRSLSSLSATFDVSTLRKTHLPNTLRSLDLKLVNVLDEGLAVDFSYLVNLNSLSIHTLQGYPLHLKGNNFPNNLRSLKLSNVEIDNWRGLPSGLEFLSCSCSPHPDSLPKALKRLELLFPDKLTITGPPLHSLYIRDTNLPPLPLIGLSKLYLHLTNVESLRRLPPTLRHLALYAEPSIRELRYLPKELAILELVPYSPILEFTEGLPSGLKDLRLGGNRSSLPTLPEGLLSLSYLAPLTTPLPASLRSLTVEADDQHLQFLAPLSALKRLVLYGKITKLPANLRSLEVLDISLTDIRTLQALPPSLISLTLNAGQVETLKGLPQTVVSLKFRNATRALI
jgi:hypothetical protein